MQLVGLKGIHWSHTIPLVGPEITIGREVDNTIVCLGDSSVSRRHARLVPGGLTYSIEDLGSANGTFVNGVRIAAPTALNPGDEIKIGGQSYRFEAEEGSPILAPPDAAPIPLRPREVSRTEQAKAGWTRGTERIYGGAGGGGGLGDLNGCAMPNLPDLSGCLKVLLYLLLALIVIMILGGLLMAIGMGMGALGGLAGGHGGGHGTPATTTGGGQQGGTQTGGSGGDQQQQQKNPGIVIKETRIEMTWHPEWKTNAPRVLLTWENQTGQSVHKIWAKVTGLDSSGDELSSANDVLIYDGKAIPTGASHRDLTVENQGFDPPGTVKPDKVEVEVTKVEG